MRNLSVSRIKVPSAELEVTARINYAISIGMALAMALFSILALVYAPTVEVLAIIGGLLLLSIAAFYLNQYGYVTLAAWVFLIGYTLFIVFSMVRNPDAASVTPYFLGVSVVLIGSVTRPEMSLVLATLCSLATAWMLSMAPLPPAQGNIPLWLGPLIIPVVFLYLLGIVAWMLGRENKRMLRNLRQIATEVREGVAVLSTAANELLATTSQVAAGARQTATAISEMTTTTEEVKQTAQVASRKAKQVSTDAHQAEQASQTGQESVEATIQSIHHMQQQIETIAASIVHLHEQNQAIGKITATVNDLAEQSNLLAVNAAIEAAKAGEQGKGFAVVAQEIRNLAEQSKQATTQVDNILNDIQKAISGAVQATERGSRVAETGVKQATEMAETIQTLANNIDTAAQAATQIAASSQQQQVGMDQVSQTMEEIRKASEQNAASTEQVEKTAQTLHKLGQQLQHVVAQLNV